MRRQTQAAGGASAGSSRSFRLDPTALPLHYLAKFDEGAWRRDASIYLDYERAIVKTRSAIGAPLTVCLPVNLFEGVAVRMTPIAEAGDIEVVVELRHRDPALSVPLVVADDPAEVVDDWQAWGKIFSLPLLLIEADGSTIIVGGSRPCPTPFPSQRRRRHSAFAGRRPRFLARRKIGRPEIAEQVGGREIIARN